MELEFKREVEAAIDSMRRRISDDGHIATVEQLFEMARGQNQPNGQTSDDDYPARLQRLLGSIERLGAFLTARMLAARDAGGRASEYVKVFKMARDAKDGLEAAGKAVSSVTDQLKTKLIPEAFDSEDLTSFTTQDGHRVTVSSRVFASIPADKRDKAFEWLRSGGHEALIIETVNSSTLSAFARSYLEENGSDLPEDLFNVAVKAEASLTRKR